MISIDFSEFTKKGLKDVVSAFNKADLPVASVEADNKPKRESGYQIKQATMTLESGQIVLLKAKAGGSLYQARLNGKILAIKDYLTADKFVAEVIGYAAANEPNYQKQKAKQLAKVKVATPKLKPVSMTVAEQSAAYQTTLTELQGHTETVNAELAVLVPAVAEKKVTLSVLQGQIVAENLKSEMLQEELKSLEGAAPARPKAKMTKAELQTLIEELRWGTDDFIREMEPGQKTIVENGITGEKMTVTILESAGTNSAAYEQGRHAAMQGYSAQAPSNLRKREEKDDYLSGWQSGKKKRDDMLRGMKVVEHAGRKAHPTIAGKSDDTYKAVLRDEGSGKDYATEAEAKEGMGKSAKNLSDFDDIKPLRRPVLEAAGTAPAEIDRIQIAQSILKSPNNHPALHKAFIDGFNNSCAIEDAILFIESFTDEELAGFLKDEQQVLEDAGYEDGTEVGSGDIANYNTETQGISALANNIGTTYALRVAAGYGNGENQIVVYDDSEAVPAIVQETSQGGVNTDPAPVLEGINLDMDRSGRHDINDPLHVDDPDRSNDTSAHKPCPWCGSDVQENQCISCDRKLDMATADRKAWIAANRELKTDEYPEDFE